MSEDTAAVGAPCATPSRVATGLVVMLATTLAISANNVLIPIAYAHGATSASTLFLRYCLLISGLLATLLVLGRPLKLPRRYWGHAVIAGCLSCMGSLGLITAFGLIPVGLGLLIMYLYPILTAIAQSAIERKPVGVVQIVCLATAFAGLAIALGVGTVGLAAGLNPWGMGSALGAALAYTGFFTWSRYGLKGADTGAATLLTSLSGATLAAIGGAVFQATGLAALHVPDLGDAAGWLAILGVSVGFSFAYFGMSWGVQLIGATSTAMLMNLETVFTLPLAAVVLGEALDARRLTGAAMVLAAVAVSQTLRARETD